MQSAHGNQTLPLSVVPMGPHHTDKLQKIQSKQLFGLAHMSRVHI